MVNTDMSLSWFRFPSEIEPEGMISLQVVLGQIKREYSLDEVSLSFLLPNKIVSAKLSWYSRAVCSCIFLVFNLIPGEMIAGGQMSRTMMGPLGSTEFPSCWRPSGDCWNLAHNCPTASRRVARKLGDGSANSHHPWLRVAFRILIL